MTDAVRLERFYRRLLIAYPARYRRRHGAEIVTTLLDMAQPDSPRPSAGEAGHLLAAGVRQRFRLPARRLLPWVAAVLVTLVLGAFGAATGSWAAAGTFAGLPSRSAFAKLSRLVADGSDRTETRDATPHSVTSRWSVVDSPGWTAEPARERLAAAGWHVTAVRPDIGTVMSSSDQTVVSRLGSAFDATRDGLHLRVAGTPSAGHDMISVLLWPAGTGARWPLTIAGTMLGMLLGWLLTAAVADRLRRAPARRAAVSGTLSGVALVILAAPALACYANLALMARTTGDGEIPVTVHSALTAGPFETFGWRWMMLELSVTGLILGVAAVALTSRGRDGDPTTGPVPG